MEVRVHIAHRARMKEAVRSDDPASRVSDAELIIRMRNGDVRAFEALYDRHSPYVIAVAVRMLGSRDEAEETAQDVFWRIWTDGFRYEPDRGRFATWLFVIAKNCCLDRLRGRAVRAEDSHVSLMEPAGGADPERETVSAERHARVYRALATLPREQREALEWCFLRGFSHTEAAAKLGTPLGTLKSRVKMAMEKLRDKLADLETMA
jgi:RNA polymerase sigma-70 factor (ECF subfamily)